MNDDLCNKKIQENSDFANSTVLISFINQVKRLIWFNLSQFQSCKTNWAKRVTRRQRQLLNKPLIPFWMLSILYSHPGLCGTSNSATTNRGKIASTKFSHLTRSVKLNYSKKFDLLFQHRFQRLKIFGASSITFVSRVRSRMALITVSSKREFAHK